MSRLFAAVTAVLASVAVSGVARAEMDQTGLTNLQVQILVNTTAREALNWHVGDKASYKLDIGGFMQGTSDNSVTQDTGTDFWMVQNINLSGQQQKIEAMINKTNGQIDKLLVNGQEQAVPKEDMQVVDMHADKVTVAAGSFDCMYAKLKDKNSGKITEAWINPKAVPMVGMLKTNAETDYGQMHMELTSFAFAGH